LILWWQGEADTREQTTFADYRDQIRRIVASIEPNFCGARMMVSMSSMRRGKISEPVRRAQGELAEENPFVVAGPDTDRIGLNGRWDGTHLDRNGVERAVVKWSQAILKVL